MTLSETDPLSGATLPALRHLVAVVADATGPYRVVCVRCGTCPAPVDGARFADRKTARAAARVATAYRARLRGWDDRAPRHDLLVDEATTDAPGASVPPADRSDPRCCWGSTEPTVDRD